MTARERETFLTVKMLKCLNLKNKEKKGHREGGKLVVKTSPGSAFGFGPTDGFHKHIEIQVSQQSLHQTLNH